MLWGKEEIARSEQFLLFPQNFQRTRENKGLSGKGLNNTGMQLHHQFVMSSSDMKQILEIVKLNCFY